MTDTVLILGAGGRFGRHAVHAFRAGGWRVRALVRPGRAGPTGVEAIHADAEDAAAVTRAAQGADVIVHALNPPYPDWARAVPALTASVITAAKAANAAVLIPGNVYGYGSRMPERLTETTPMAPDTRKGRIRVEMEAAFRDAGVRAIILRAGDFLDTEVTGNWFDGQIAPGVARGRAMFPGPLDRVHAWAYLPDMARAARMLAEKREDLPRLAEIGFPGFALTGAELIAAMEAASGRELRVRSMPWAATALLAPFWPMLREVREMRYLWARPHFIDGALLARLLPDFRPTPLAQAMPLCLAPFLEAPAALAA